MQILTALLAVLVLGSTPAAAAPDDALDAFRRKAHMRLAEEALAQHDIDAAQQRLEAALELAEKTGGPEFGLALERLGDIYRRRNQLRKAGSLYQRALEAAPEAGARLHERLGAVAIRRGRYQEAAVHFQKAAAAGGAAPELRLRLGTAHLRAGDAADAKAAFQQAVGATQPRSLELAALHESIARRHLWFGGDLEEAFAHAESALAIRREHRIASPAQYDRALTNRALGASDMQLAEEYLQQLPTWQARQIRARRLRAKGDLEQAAAQQLSAVEELRALEAEKDALVSALERLSGLESRRGRNAPAAYYQQEALELRRELARADSPESLNSLERLSSLLERSGRAVDVEAALVGYLGVLGDLPNRAGLARARVYERFGDVLLRKDGADEAASRYQSAVQIRERAWGENDARLRPILEKLADALRRGGREEEARGAESQIALLSVFRGVTREPPQGRRDTGVWLSEPSGIAFLGVALLGATAALVWLGWSTFTALQPAFEAGLRKPAPRIAEAPSWRPIARPNARYPVWFHGRGAPLFGIWSVNMALTLVTVGLYFFWGKIRTRRYFWGQTEIAGDRFAFRGTGGELLIGWMKAAPILALALWGPGLLDLAWEAPNAGLYGAGVAVALLGILWPLAEVGAHRYRLSRTSWRAIRFSFRGATWPYMKIWLTGMPLWIVTLGLWGPFFDAARRRYLLEHARFGDAKFSCNIHGKDLFSFYLVAWVLFLPTLGGSYFWYKALAERYYWSHTQLVHNQGVSRAGFECTLKAVDLLVLWIQTSATLALTLGLGWPWTRVWEARLRLQTIAMTGDFRPGRIRQSTDGAGAAGEGAADFLGLDFGFFA